MAGTIVVSDIRSDNDNTITFTANTGETIFTANLSSGIDGNFLANTGVTAAVYGGASQIPVVTVDEKGRITSAANVSISAGGSSISAGDSNVAVVDSGTGRVEMNVDGSTRAIFNEYGLGLGPNVPSSGIGIRFPATQSASSDANTLDDYEEGTWTPAFVNFGTGTYQVQLGRYTKIGDTVFAWFHLNVSGLGTASGNISISGFPFAALNVSNYYGMSSSLFGDGWATARTSLTMLLGFGNTTSSSLFYGSAATSATAATYADINGGDLIGCMIYKT